MATNPQTNTQTDRTDITIHCAAKLNAPCKNYAKRLDVTEKSHIAAHSSETFLHARSIEKFGELTRSGENASSKTVKK